MPNWCRGELKIRGTKENIKRFITEGLEPIGFSVLEGKKSMTISESEYGINIVSEGCAFYFKGTHRQFADQKEIDFDYPSDSTRHKPVLVIKNFSGAWDIDSDGLRKLSQDFDVDFKVYGFERGMEFNRDIEIVGGKIIKDHEIKFDDYDWECACPSIGG